MKRSVIAAAVFSTVLMSVNAFAAAPSEEQGELVIIGNVINFPVVLKAIIAVRFNWLMLTLPVLPACQPVKSYPAISLPVAIH